MGDFLNHKWYSKDNLEYRVGALLYSPAIHPSIAKSIVAGSIPGLSAVAFCVEDAIQDNIVEAAEQTLITSLRLIYENMPATLPLLFIRVRCAAQIISILQKLGSASEILTGFVLPKYDLTNAESYRPVIYGINCTRPAGRPLYVMPILESTSIASKAGRIDMLNRLYEQVSAIAEYVLNIRVGGNDFSNMLGVRRTVNQTIYENGAINSILSDIISVFGRDYVVSGPVWEYFDNGGTDEWRTGLLRELALDKLNGFIGKTAIHPSQLPVIKEAMKVDRADYEDARQVVEWADSDLAVAKSAGGDRMNEVKVHINWAHKTTKLASIYGVTDN